MSSSSSDQDRSGDLELFSVADPMARRPSTAPQAKRPAGEENNHQQQQEEEEEEEEEERDEDIMMTVMEKVSNAIPRRDLDPPPICEVPRDLTEGNKGAYTPKVVCIGPLFDSERKTASMLRLERYKLRCVNKLIVGESAAWSVEVHVTRFNKCFDMIKRLVRRVRASYSTISPHMSSEKLAKKMLLDGCFVLHRLLKHAREGNGGDLDQDDWNELLGRCWVWETVKRDLLLLSNQVPFFVLEELFKQLGNGDTSGDILVNCGLQLLSSLHPRRLHTAPIPCSNVHHLLHLFYLSIDLPPQDREPSTSKDPEAELTWWVPCAKELEEAGVTIRARKYGAKSFLDIRFRRRCGILEIPPLQLFDYSEPLFRNLIAFEQTYPNTAGHITAYAIFMDCLLKTPKDARLLHKSGVLLNHMNGQRNDTASMAFFSHLCAETHTSADRNYLAGVMNQVVKYQNGKCPRWRADLVTNYFPNPWVTMSVVAAVILLVLTVMQTVYTVYPYYKPSK